MKYQISTDAAIIHFCQNNLGRGTLHAHVGNETGFPLKIGIVTHYDTDRRCVTLQDEKGEKHVISFCYISIPANA